MNTSWDLKKTEQLVGMLYGWPRAREKFLDHAYSVNRRLRYGDYHYREAIRLHDEYMRDHLKGRSLIEVQLGSSEDRQTLDSYIYPVQAHALAFAQGYHSIPDIHAHTLYYALKLDKSDPLPPRKIAAHSVRAIVKKYPELQELGEMLQSFHDSEEFEYLDGLVNHSKHRSLVLAGLVEDWTGTREEMHELRVNAFTYQKPERQRALKEVFPVIALHLSKHVTDTGNKLHEILGTRTADPDPLPLPLPRIAGATAAPTPSSPDASAHG